MPRVAFVEKYIASVIEVFEAYFRAHPEFDYLWPKNQNGKGYQATLEVKRSLKEAWYSATDSQQKERLCKEIVSDWGGIKSNAPETFQMYVSRVEQTKPALPLSGVASYSKIFSVVRPDEFAIYDARVAASLNAVQKIFAAPVPVFFPYIPSRNKTICAFMNQHSRQRAKVLGWNTDLKRDETYPAYLTLIHSLSRRFPEKQIYDFEMQLFSEAEELLKRA